MHPQAEQKFNFLRKLGRSERWKRIGSFSVCFLRATTKNGRQLFRGRKVHPRQNPAATPMPVFGGTLNLTLALSTVC